MPFLLLKCPLLPVMLPLYPVHPVPAAQKVLPLLWDGCLAFVPSADGRVVLSHGQWQQKLLFFVLADREDRGLLLLPVSWQLEFAVPIPVLIFPVQRLRSEFLLFAVPVFADIADECPAVAAIGHPGNPLPLFGSGQ